MVLAAVALLQGVAVKLTGGELEMTLILWKGIFVAAASRCVAAGRSRPPVATWPPSIVCEELKLIRWPWRPLWGAQWQDVVFAAETEGLISPAEAELLVRGCPPDQIFKGLPDSFFK